MLMSGRIIPTIGEPPTPQAFDSRDITLPTKLWFFQSSQSYGFSSSHAEMWEFNHEENWAMKNWCFWTVVLEKTLKSPLDCKEIKPVNLKGNQPWIPIGRTDAEAETNTLATSCEELTHWKRLWCWEGLGAGGEGDDRMRWLDGITDSIDVSLKWTPGVGDGQGGLACCDSWGRKESDTTEWLNWTEREKLIATQ